MALAIPFIMTAGAAISAMGAIQSAKAQQTAGLYNARQNEQNAQLALEQSNVDASRFHTSYLKKEGSMVAAFGGSGLTSEGTTSVLADSAANARLDEESIRYKGRLRAIGFYNTSTLDRFGADQAVKQGELKSAAAILSGVGQVGATSVAGNARLRQGSGTLDE